MWIVETYRTLAFSLYGTFNFTKSAYSKHAAGFRKEDTDIDLTGKTCIVTGANSGLGLASAEALASKGATVCLVCRNKERGEKAASDIKSKTGNDSVRLEVCDLSSVKDVRNFASRFVCSDQPLYVLINNAGLMENERKVTAEGLEMNFAVNVAGTYTLTELLIPALEKAAPESRVVTVSSGGMYGSPLVDDLQYSDGKFNGALQYARNKRIQVLELHHVSDSFLRVLQVALTERWAELCDKGIGFYSMHPGWADTPGVVKSLPQFQKRFENKLRTAEEGSDTVVWLATQAKDKLESGGFYFDRSQASKHLPTCGTGYKTEQVDRLISRIRSLCGFKV